MTLQLGAAQLTCAFLFGGSLLYSSAFAAFLFTSLPPDEAGKLLRKAFPGFYLWVMGTSLLGAALYLGIDRVASYTLLAIAGSTLPARQVLMPAINKASDEKHEARFRRLHGLSVIIGLAQIGAAGFVLLRVGS